VQTTRAASGPLEDQLVDATTAGAVLGLRLNTIRKLTRKGELPFVRVTGRRSIRYRLTDLEALVRLRTVPMRSAQ
jgi:excisionase family DNA binding protein